jgi:hypothetical protein
LGIYPGQNTLYLDLKNFSKFFWLHLVPGTTSKIKNLKTKVVPGRDGTLFLFFQNKVKNKVKTLFALFFGKTLYLG